MLITTPPDQRRYAPLTPSPLNPNTYLNIDQGQQDQHHPAYPKKTTRRSPKLGHHNHNHSSRLAQKYAALAQESPTQRLLRQKAAAAWRLAETLRSREGHVTPAIQELRLEAEEELQQHNYRYQDLRRYHHHQQRQHQHPGGDEYSSPFSTISITTVGTATANATTTTLNSTAGKNWISGGITNTTTAALSIHAPAMEEFNPMTPDEDDEGEEEGEEGEEIDLGLMLVVKKSQRAGTSAGAGAEVPGWERYRDVPTAASDNTGVDGRLGGRFDVAGSAGGGNSGRACSLRLMASPPALPLRLERSLLPLHTVVNKRAGRRRFVGAGAWGAGANRDGRMVLVRRVIVAVALLFGLALIHSLATRFGTAQTE
ncbi:hypothetical protein C7999DRAFT_34491 [Corynascus novoguineensis]|uniref:Uncharacterized protein n=1 Tax=Corynascus novoguineensis TaxID=1126955 RepID=A0AAN7CN18_9PEZI|nr:hypothetical protein C7999DRAFT_34491 [Corynascus novoguineensis]